ncbi:MAG: Twitching motility protein [Spartobacteria bacterium]|nr:Twitching motility protein [Spartobacteria bacterium]
MDKKTVDALLTSMIQSEKGISDLLFIEGKPPLVEVYGHLREFPIDTPGSLLTEELIDDIAKHVIGDSERLLKTFAETGSCDTSYAIEAVARLRVNVYKQNGRRAIVMRRFPSSIPTLEKLGLPAVFREIVKEKNGIVLVTGATGSGKTTTLAALVNELNQTQAVHLLTLEDPIEFLHSHGKAAVSQRELGKDFPSFADGLRVALRQAPKVILVGEIRDRETMEIAMTASETGHLVLTTLHTVSAGQAINRILGFFAQGEEEQIRQRLSDTLRYIVSQRLVSKVDGRRLLMTEVLGSNLRTRETIRYGESENKTFNEIIEAGSTLGWHTFDQSLLNAREADLVTDETVLTYCTNKAKVRQALEQMRKRRGLPEQESVSGLKLDIVEPIKIPTSTTMSPAAPGLHPAANS